MRIHHKNTFHKEGAGISVTSDPSGYIFVSLCFSYSSEDFRQHTKMREFQECESAREVRSKGSKHQTVKGAAGKIGTQTKCSQIQNTYHGES